MRAARKTRGCHAAVQPKPFAPKNGIALARGAGIASHDRNPRLQGSVPMPRKIIQIVTIAAMALAFGLAGAADGVAAPAAKAAADAAKAASPIIKVWHCRYWSGGYGCRRWR